MRRDRVFAHAAQDNTDFGDGARLVELRKGALGGGIVDLGGAGASHFFFFFLSFFLAFLGFLC